MSIFISVKVDHVIEVTPGSNFTFSYDDEDMNVTFCALHPPNQEEGQKARFGHVPKYSNVKTLANIYRYSHESEVISFFLILSSVKRHIMLKT